MAEEKNVTVGGCIPFNSELMVDPEKLDIGTVTKICKPNLTLKRSKLRLRPLAFVDGCFGVPIESLKSDLFYSKCK